MKTSHSHEPERQMDVYTVLLSPGDILIDDNDEYRAVISTVSVSRTGTEKGVAVVYTGTVLNFELKPGVERKFEHCLPGETALVTIEPEGKRLYNVRRLSSNISTSERHYTDGEILRIIYEYMRREGRNYASHKEIIAHLVDDRLVLGERPTPQMRKILQARLRTSLKESRAYRSQGGYIKLINPNSVEFAANSELNTKRAHIIRWHRVVRGLELVITGLFPNVVLDHEQ